ncbi:DNA-methyltransferase [Liquorilactobacillus vini]|uniref:DNA-methyltransferase n=1 Tax=Liquorilactobacillus vini TaxID=238015 RepID=UPI000300BB61|nr:site-specific DNA-methyltransferase [Liquorilactobacillus vini]
MIDLEKGDCLELMKKIPDNSIDAIITDPPYEYLNHRLDRLFNEEKVFKQWNRVVKDDGFLVFFGRGESFHRWNYFLNSMGWKFKEEIIWDKRRVSNLMGPIGRRHETISILTKKGKVRKIRVPYLQKNQYDFKKIKNDLARLCGALGNPQKLLEIKKYVLKKEIDYNHSNPDGLSLKGNTKLVSMEAGLVKMIFEGIREQSIIAQNAVHSRQNRVHPTQKPTPLMEHLIKLVSDKDYTILDPFMGSGSTGVACVNLDRSFIGYEIEDDYFEIAKNRIKKAQDKKITELV